MTEQDKYDCLVFIGRLQGPHFEHLNVIYEGLKRSAKVLVLLGSANSNRTIRNPFTFDERVKIILQDRIINEAAFWNRIEFVPLNDYTYRDSEWVAKVQELVSARATGRIGLIGCSKDNTSYYLKLFPQWESFDVPLDRAMNSTDVRQRWLEGGVYDLDNEELPAPRAVMAEAQLHFLVHCRHLVEEYAWTNKYKLLWSNTPYPVIFNTVDAVVVQSGHVLLVKRGAMPGKGLWALPGGYINPDENLEQSMLRELAEETKIHIITPMTKGFHMMGRKATDEFLQQNIVKSETFADPHRSPRGRVITHAFLIKLPDKTKLPHVKGSDDAEKAKWIPLSEIRTDMMFEDHAHIIRKLCAGL